ncbi:DUF1816 domain-containing protein [Microseira wollei]|uniref:Uncharacterized protein n=1 Tax=Microseira wollei NIES-4236 TaxID=2530354 RepID=A0AAV3X0L3_9CYAN|nr:DUF1816 domain-containing protein [Microseira wollei]GET36212.1 hypothetical protein MiSe_09600 [Microseira wollei NIES-4236]
MEDSHKQELDGIKSNFLDRLTELFSNQMDSIILAVELLKCSDYIWTEAEEYYLEFIKKYAIQMVEFIKAKTILINPNEADLKSRLDRFGKAWWVEITTTNPRNYYFGPFISAKEAGIAQPSYMEAIEHKGEQIQGVRIQQYKPTFLSILNCQSTESCPIQIDQIFKPDLN